MWNVELNIWITFCQSLYIHNFECLSPVSWNYLNFWILVKQLQLSPSQILDNKVRPVMGVVDLETLDHSLCLYLWFGVFGASFLKLPKCLITHKVATVRPFMALKAKHHIWSEMQGKDVKLLFVSPCKWF